MSDLHFGKAVGSRIQVMNGTAHHTSGGLTKKDIKVKRKNGEVHYVSRKKSSRAAKLRNSGKFRNDDWIKAIKMAAKEHPHCTAPEIAKYAKPIYAEMKKGLVSKHRSSSTKKRRRCPSKAGSLKGCWIKAIKMAAKKHPNTPVPELAKHARPIYAAMKKKRESQHSRI